MAFNEPPLMEACRTGNVSAVPPILTSYTWASDADRDVLKECLMAVCNSHQGSPTEKRAIANMLLNSLKGTSLGVLGRALIAACRHGHMERRREGSSRVRTWPLESPEEVGYP